MIKIIASICIGMIIFTGCGSSKPSKSEVKKVFTESIMEDESKKLSGKEKQQLEEYVSCFVDDIYGDLSTKTLEALTSEDKKVRDEYEASDKENEAFDESLKKCEDKLPEGGF